MSKKRRSFTPEYKEEVAKLVVEYSRASGPPDIALGGR